MHRRPLLAMLADYAARQPDELAMIERIRSLVESHDDCFDRTCRPGHVTASAWVLSSDRRRCLLLHHKKLGRWLQPGGHADGDADVTRVALREATEESGLAQLSVLTTSVFDVDVHPIPERRNAAGELVDTAHDHHDVRFLLGAEGPDDLVLSDESHALGWFTPAEVRAQTDEASVLRLLDKAAPWIASE
ncbi:NUDIX domain protein [Pseudobythopirellula maris]|uniref:NUDIX domain protein n=1 Tax=Pseudobythopirellula maris TaxID=2527991 RepID=A0A5C5ZVP8_9BACT|nr:NUDIX hydrolase [Pseudobythopirellula maris]TWT91021.1 NUDIX domain protein [Pseudobythopirellula maris]